MTVVRGKHLKIRLFDPDGNILQLWNPNSGSFGHDANQERRERLGEAIPKPRQQVQGHSGTLTFEVEDPTIDDIIDLINQNAREANPSLYWDMLRRIRYPRTGEIRVYAYPDLVLNVDQEASDRESPVQDTMNWTSSPRKRIQ